MSLLGVLGGIFILLVGIVFGWLEFKEIQKEKIKKK